MEKIGGSMEYKFIIPGNPVAKARARAYRNGLSIKHYDPQKSITNAIRWEIIPQMRSQGLLEPIQGPIEVEMTFHMPAPKIIASRYLKNGFPKHTKKPDCDNLIKEYGDAMNNIVYKDDSQVFKIIAEKVYSLNPKVDIIVRTDQLSEKETL
jgi:Holliday junction resolvase RusA-like endonuclease